jgi:hypothetical protein
VITTETLVKVTCDHPGCTQILGGDEHEFWTARSLVPVADANHWMFEPETGVAYCDVHAPEASDD